MKGSEPYFDWVEAEKAADLMAGDNPGLVVWIVEGWFLAADYEDTREADDMVLVVASTHEEASDEIDEYGWAAYEIQYDATKPAHTVLLWGLDSEPA